MIKVLTVKRDGERKEDTFEGIAGHGVIQAVIEAVEVFEGPQIPALVAAFMSDFDMLFVLSGAVLTKRAIEYQGQKADGRVAESNELKKRIQVESIRIGELFRRLPQNPNALRIMNDCIEAVGAVLESENKKIHADLDRAEKAGSLPDWLDSPFRGASEPDKVPDYNDIPDAFGIHSAGEA